MHDKKMIKMAQSIRIKITEQRTKEMQVAEENRNSRYIYLEAYLKIVSSLIKAAALDEKIEINENDINELLEKTFKEFITQENFSWLTEEYFLKNEEKFRRSFGGGYRIKSLISLINSFQGIHINQKVLDQEKILIISKDNQFVSEELDQFSMYSLSLLQRIYNLFKQNREFNVFDELLSLNTPDLSLEYLESSLLFLKGIGYINFNSPLLHMGIEVQFTNFEPIDSESGEGDDYKVNQIFNEYNYLKKLRIYSLEIFANLQSNEDRTQFITEYFECDNSKNILALFENFVPKADNVNHILSELRQEALNKEVEGVYDEKTNTKIGGLNEKQLEIYKSDPNNSLSVIAGPGTGKTHTLIMCIVRLIHEFNVKPEKILVLAYNRAIVNELKHRINSLLRKLGYGNLARGIKIHTFHSLVKYCLHDLVKDIDVNKWIETFNNDYAEHAGIISNRLQNPQYFFVDEYQDISKERLDMLNHINSKKPTMVIGDPDQSIYGYERKLHSADISAVPYFQKFIQQNDAKKMYLNMNYRSTEEIISEVSRIIDKNEDRMNTEILVGLDKSKNPQSLEKIEISDFDYESIVNRLIKLINETKSNVEKYQDCAVLFRTNSELYYFNSLLLKNESLKNHEIIIQGSSTNFFKLREISILVDQIRKHSGKSFDEFYNNIFEATIERILKKYSKWNPRTFEVFKSLIEEFKASSVGSITVGDLLNYFDEIRDVDDAGLYKLVQMQQLSNSDNTRIILSTIHKSKGLEFDSVILPFSIVELPFKEKDPQFFDEERRLLYVATSRAKNKLIIYRSERERALDSNTSFELDTSKFPQNGLLCPNRLGSIIISSGVSDEKCHWLGFVSRKAYLKYINDEVIQSDNLEIEFDNGWFLTHASHKLFKMSNNFNEFIATKFTPDPGLILKGLFCSNVVRYYYSDSVVYDEINNTNYSNDWDHEAQEMGYIYLVGFEGFLHE
ncbi:MAG: ATP-dependent helicase [Melioribacteraceae bacterium]|nr:ATP-dependent helicase [Melioribacteraceae bacterium]